jgi:hypothetical protein
VNPPPRKPPRHPRFVASIVILLMLEGSSMSAEPARAAERVIVLQPTTASPAIRRCLARIRDELSADRFQVILADSGAVGDPAAVIERAGEADDDTILALFGDPAEGQAELCVVQRAARRAAVRRATVVMEDPERMPEALATRALELLRATALELSLTSSVDSERDSERPPRATAEREAAIPQPAPKAPFVLVDMGLGVWNSIDGPPAALVPIARLGLRLSERIATRISLAGLGSRPRVATTDGSATISQNMGLLEFIVLPGRDRRFHPMLSLGAGVLEVAVAGTGAGSYEGRSPQQWSAALDGGVGVAFVVGARAALVAEFHALLASPHPVVRFVDTRAATIGYPSMVFTLTLQVAP